MDEPPKALKAMAISTVVGVAVLLLAYGLLNYFTPVT